MDSASSALSKFSLHDHYSSLILHEGSDLSAYYPGRVHRQSFQHRQSLPNKKLKRALKEPQYLRQGVAGPHKSPRPRIILLVKFSILKIFMNSADLNSDNSSYSDFRMKNIFQKCFVIQKDDFCGKFTFIKYTLGVLEGLEHVSDLYLNLWDFRP